MQHRKQNLIPMTLLLALAFVVVIVVAGGAGDRQRESPAPSFDRDILPVLQRSCAFAGCHAGREAWLGLDLTPAVAYDNLVGRPSQEVPGLLLVKPFDVDRSYLVQKLLGLQARGARMPLKADPLDADEIGRIIRWIQAGAPRSEGEP